MKTNNELIDKAIKGIQSLQRRKKKHKKSKYTRTPYQKGYREGEAVGISKCIEVLLKIKKGDVDE